MALEYLSCTSIVYNALKPIIKLQNKVPSPHAHNLDEKLPGNHILYIPSTPLPPN